MIFVKVFLSAKALFSPRVFLPLTFLLALLISTVAANPAGHPTSPQTVYRATQQQITKLPEPHGRGRMGLNLDEPVSPAPALPEYWIQNTSRALDRASREGKLLVVLFHDRDCTQCYRLESELSRSPGIGAIRECMLFAIADTNRDGTADSLAREFEVYRYPTISLLISNGSAIHEVSRLIGYGPEQDILAYLRSMYLDGAKHPAAPAMIKKDPLAACPAFEKVGIVSPNQS